MLKIILAQPRGFCAGVVRAIDIVEAALRKWGAPVYVFHPIVHNERVIDVLAKKGAVFVADMEHVPRGATVIFSAHGVGVRMRQAAESRELEVIDATCPLVEKVHAAVRRFDALGRRVVIVGHREHDEVQGTLGQISAPAHVISSAVEAGHVEIDGDVPLAFVTQTTLSSTDVREIVCILRARFPGIVGPDAGDICYATENRQRAVRALCAVVDIVLVVGSASSSNANRLLDVARAEGRPAYLLADGRGLQTGWFEGLRTIGLTAGASTPDDAVADVLAALARIAETEISVMAGPSETVHFKFPAGLAPMP